MKPGVIFGNLIVSVRGDKRLNPDRLRRMAESGSVAEAVKIMYEAGYGDGHVLENQLDYDTLIDGEFERTLSLFDELSTDETITYCFLAEYLYHNAKVFYKARYGGGTEASYKYASDIKDSILEKKYTGLPEILEKTLLSLDDKFSEGNPNPREIDTAIDRAYYQDIFLRLKKVHNKSIKKYFYAKAGLNNMSALYRAKLLGLPVSAALGMLIPEGSNFDFEKMYGSDISTFPEFFKETEYYEFALRLSAAIDTDTAAAFVSFEAERDNYLLSLIRRDIDNFFKIDRIIYYYVSRITELKTARMIMVLLNNKIAKEYIFMRLRDIQ